MVPNSDLAWHPLIEQRYPLLSSAILAGASAQLRNMASTGGNLLQRTRCFYFYDTATPCNKREPGSGCSAIKGLNRINAILGTSEACIATHPSDMCVALAALDAKVHVAGPAGRAHHCLRRFPSPARRHAAARHQSGAERDHHGGGASGARVSPSNYTYLKIRDRLSYAFAWYRSPSALEIDGDTIEEARVALGGVAHKPWRDVAAEAALRGQAATRRSFKRAAESLLRDAKGYAHNTFKIDLARRANRSRADPGGARHAAIAVQQEDREQAWRVTISMVHQRHQPPRGPAGRGRIGRSASADVLPQHAAIAAQYNQPSKPMTAISAQRHPASTAAPR